MAAQNGLCVVTSRSLAQNTDIQNMDRNIRIERRSFLQNNIYK